MDTLITSFVFPSAQAQCSLLGRCEGSTHSLNLLFNPFIFVFQLVKSLWEVGGGGRQGVDCRAFAQYHATSLPWGVKWNSCSEGKGNGRDETLLGGGEHFHCATSSYYSVSRWLFSFHFLLVCFFTHWFSLINILGMKIPKSHFCPHLFWLLLLSFEWQTRG